MTRKPTDRAVRTLQRVESDRARIEAEREAQEEADRRAAEPASDLLACALVAGGWPIVWQWREERARQGHRRLGTLTAVAVALGVG